MAVPPIVRRADWGGDLPSGPLVAEDVRFLLVHHTAEPGNDYGPDDPVRLLRGIHAFHTGASKGWPDVAYNFFVDRYGTIYEGRAGSVDGPVRGSATGGNQGYSQLCCFLGDHTSEPPTPEALGAMWSLLAWLADRYSIDTGPGATARFTSLGSNRWPAGAAVETATISAHRDVSQTTCPGDACYALVRTTFPVEVSARRAPGPAATTTTAPPGTAPGPTTPATTGSAPTSVRAAPERDEPAAAGGPAGQDEERWPLVAGAGALAAAAVAGVVALRRRRG
ncbi:N-acetylmuramoyl-L-alanine amidase [Dermatobacter hominis]|uniref:N-acetylmuramoyl-L-alanine amidase n=1 Tax=Dermatobacter hominis TaxID=2884263 RepID=UPI001D0F6632|nr:N-acetylmuramoyl-L-alanine amidase [Dermatobacter hominis]UDY37904.1 N-acetylmuramoyl-L-alanine amidase [Dermatobacter hominis]